MNQTISFSSAIDGYFLAARARQLSPCTLADYSNTFRKFSAYLGNDPEVARLSSKDIEGFILQQTTVSKKTILNYLIGLSAFFHWASDEKLVKENIVSHVQKPKPEKPVITELTESDIKALLAVLERSTSYTRPGKMESSHRLPNAFRNRAIILLLLDTGMRASEICSLKISGIDVRNSRLKIFGKGNKERILPFSARTGQALWRYLATRKDDRVNDPLFKTSFGHAMDRDQLRRLLAKMGRRANVADVHPHRFRHTFAINYLRNGGDGFTLQMMLGHSTMEMVSTYLHIAQADLDSGHRRASPVDNWKL